MFIGGEWVDPAGTDTIDVISPHTEEVVGRVPEGTEADIDRAVAAARDAFDNGDWPRMAPAERIAEIVQNFSDVYAARMMDMAGDHHRGDGLADHASRSWRRRPAPWMMLNTFLQIGAEYPWEEQRTGVLGSDVIVRREGVGVVGAIVPWNVPQFVTMSKLAPALLVGLHDRHQAVARDAARRVPHGRAARGGRHPEGRRERHPRRPRGRRAPRPPPGRRQDRVHRLDRRRPPHRLASAASSSSACSLELGGKSAAIILDDADLAATIEGLKFASLMNNGQACVAQTRILASREPLRRGRRRARRDGRRP